MSFTRRPTMAGKATPTRKYFEPAILNIEIETCLALERFQENQKSNGKAAETIESRLHQLKQVARATNLNEPEEVKTWLSSDLCKWNNNTKTKFIDTYTAFLTFMKKTWNAPTYRKIDKMPFIPTEQEVDILISGCGKKTATVMQTLKETGMRIGELTQLKWINIDLERKTVNITPEKGSNPRILPISDKLIAMLNQMPHNKETIFQVNKDLLRDYFCKQRARISEKLSNPRIKEISFKTLRHWKGTMEYHNTKDILHVKYILGHKNINCTLIYINIEAALFLQSTDQWTSIVTHNLEEEAKAIEANFTLVRSINETTAIYKKRK